MLLDTSLEKIFPPTAGFNGVHAMAATVHEFRGVTVVAVAPIVTIQSVVKYLYIFFM